jgi:YVTN family beta-propeller protein
MQMVLKPDGGEIYVNNFDADSVVVIDTSTNELNGSFSVGKNPICGVISRDAQRLYIANYGSNSVSVLEPPTRQVLASVPVGVHPETIYLSPDNVYLFVLNSGSNDVSVLRTGFITSGNNSLFTVVPTGANPSAVVIK